MNVFLLTGFLALKMSWKRRIFTSLAEAALVCLLAQIRFENWLGCDCSFVGKQCALLFSGSVAFNQCNAGGCWEKETVEREMEGERQSMISPSACFSSVSCRSSDPFVMLSHGEIWLGSLPSSQNWRGKRKGWGWWGGWGWGGCAAAHCEWTTSPALSLSEACGHLPRLSLSNLALLCLCTPGTNERRLLSPCPCALMVEERWDYWHSLSHPPGWVVNEKEWMADTVKGS